MAGQKGRSGRHKAYQELNTNELLKMAENSLRSYFRDEAIPLEKKAALAALLYSKAIKQETAHTIELIAGNDKLILDKYMDRKELPYVVEGNVE